MPIKQYAFNHFAPKWANNIYVGLFENTIMPDVVEFPHKHNYYELLWIKEGSGIQGIDFQKRTVKPNSLYFISPNQLITMHHQDWFYIGIVVGVFFILNFYFVPPKQAYFFYKHSI